MAQNKQKKAGFATLVGRPNVGKSTLMNHLIGQKIAITSNKPQTTRNRIQTVYTGPKGQIVFLDTPGIHKAKNKLGNYMVKVAESTFSDVDVILWLVEPTTYIGAGERHILEQLKRSRLPVILVINKIDTVPKTAVLEQWKPTARDGFCRNRPGIGTSQQQYRYAVGLHFQISSLWRALLR